MKHPVGTSLPDPAIDRPERSGNVWLLILLALTLIAAAAGFAYMSREQAEPYVMALLGLLAVVGVFSLFAGAIGFLRFGGQRQGNPLAKAYLDSMAEGVLVAEKDGRIVYANQAYADLTGATDSSDIRTVERMLSGDPNATESVFRLTQASRDGLRAQEEIRLAKPLGATEGSPSWYRVRVRPISGAAVTGSASSAALNVWQIADITRERDEQENSFQQLQRVINFLDHAPAGFLSADAEGRIVYLNATLADWLGYDLASFEAGGVTLGEVISGEGDALVRSIAGEPGEVKTETIDLDMRKRTGQQLPVRLIHRVAVAPDGALGDSRTLVLNRSGEGEDALEKAEVRFARFFNNTPIAIAAVDSGGRIGRTNAPFAKMFGGGENAREGAILTEMVAGDNRDGLVNALKKAADGQGGIDPVDAVLSYNGQRSARFFVSAVTDEETDGEAAIVYVLDTTDQRELEAQFAQSQKMQAVGQLAGGVAHDFNNVLTAIIGFSDLLLANHRPTDPSFQDIMNIKQNANRAAGLVRQLLAFSRRQTLRPQVLGLTEVLGELSILLDRLLGETIELKMVHGRDLWPVMADLNQLEQVIVNLAVNARDAMPDGGKLSITTRNVPEKESASLGGQGMPEGEYVLIEVADTGTGMSPEVMSKIFEPFFSTKDVGKGTGLGLSTVYGIVKQSGGYIYLDSIEDKGTTFRILLPRHIVEEKVEEVVEAAAPPPVTDLTGSATILLVEDEEAVRAFAARALASRGYTVHEASTGAEALEVMAEVDGTVDLVVSDVVMPEMDGPSLLRELRKTQPDLKIIFVSGYAEEAFKKNLPENEKFSFLPKPFSLKQLATAVKETLVEK